MLKTLLLEYSLKNEDVIACASTGIASLNYKNGSTLHSFFKIPVEIRKTRTTCNIFKDEHLDLIKKIQNAKFIIWDEATMLSNKILDILDLTLRDICNNDVFLGGKVFILAGDWRQCLPIIVNGHEQKIIDDTLLKHNKWHLFEQFTLNVNMRCINKISKKVQMCFSIYFLKKFG